MDAEGSVNLVLDLCITQERYRSNFNPVITGTFHYPVPHDIDQPLNEVAADKIRDYRADYNKRPSNLGSISFKTAVATTSDHLHCELVRILFLQTQTGNRSL